MGITSFCTVSKLCGINIHALVSSRSNMNQMQGEKAKEGRSVNVYKNSKISHRLHTFRPQLCVISRAIFQNIGNIGR